VFLFGTSVWLSFLSRDARARFSSVIYALIAILIAFNVHAYRQQRETMIAANGWFQGQHEHSRAFVAQFAADPPQREKILSNSNDLFLDDPAHFLENVERAYLHLTGASPADSIHRP
jgi:hypothetical protein